MKKQYLYFIPALAFLAVYHGTFLHIIRDWATPEGSHGILIFAVGIYLVWIRRHEIMQLQPDPALMPGGFVFAAGCLAFYAGVISSTLVVQTLSMIPVLLGMILLFGGISHFKYLWLPVCYLVFLTGFVEYFLGGFAIYVQQMTAWSAAAILRIMGFPVFLDYTIITLPHISLEVVRACSGISHIIALLALAIPLAHLTQKNRIRKIVVVVSALGIGFLANTIRIVLIGLYTKINPDVPIHGPNETLRVTIIFFVGLVVLLLFNAMLAGWKTGRGGQPDPGEDKRPDPPGGFSAAFFSSGSAFTRKQVYSFVLWVFICTVTLGLVLFQTPKPVEIGRSLSDFPRYIAGFKAADIPHAGERIRPFEADSELIRRYENENGKQVELYIGYLEIQDRKRKIVGYQSAWLHQEASRISFRKNDDTIVVNRTRSDDRQRPSDIYFWYSLDGKTVRNQYVGKAVTFLNGMFKRRTNGAVVIVSTRNEQDDIAPFIAEMYQAITNHLNQ